MPVDAILTGFKGIDRYGPIFVEINTAIFLLICCMLMNNTFSDINIFLFIFYLVQGFYLTTRRLLKNG